MTGDQADSAQRNEMIWVRELIEGGTPLDFNSGSTNPDDYDPTAHPSCAAYPPTAANRAEALRYTGVQDYDDYDEAPTPLLLRPGPAARLLGRGRLADLHRPHGPRAGAHDHPRGPRRAELRHERQPRCPRAGQRGRQRGLRGHRHELPEDPRLHGRSPRRACSTRPCCSLRPGRHARASRPAAALRRQAADEGDLRDGEDNGHGFDFVDPAEDTASNGSASYYAWDPPQAPGFRFISIDTNSEGGQTSKGWRAAPRTATSTTLSSSG